MSEDGSLEPHNAGLSKLGPATKRTLAASVQLPRWHVGKVRVQWFFGPIGACTVTVAPRALLRWWDVAFTITLMRIPLRQPSVVAKLALLILIAHSGSLPESAAAQTSRRPVLAVFAHPDDERVVGPLLARLSREGRDVHLVIATDGSKGVTAHGGIPAGPLLAAVRAKESECAATRLGVRQLHMVGMEDGSLGSSMTILADLRTRLSAIIDRVQPEAIITFGPEGGTGHPDHRLVSSVTTEIVQGEERHRRIGLFYASLPAERLRSAPPSVPRVNAVAGKLLMVRLPVEKQDIAAARDSFACHATQYTPAQMGALNRTMAHVWNGVAYLRPWNGPLRSRSRLFRR